jgi:hypothetical protein
MIEEHDSRSPRRVDASWLPLDLAQVVGVYRAQTPGQWNEWVPPAQLLARLKEIDPAFSLARLKASSITALVNAHPDLFETRRLPGRGRPVQVRCRELDLPAALVPTEAGQEKP